METGFREGKQTPRERSASLRHSYNIALSRLVEFQSALTGYMSTVYEYRYHVDRHDAEVAKVIKSIRVCMENIDSILSELHDSGRDTRHRYLHGLADTEAELHEEKVEQEAKKKKADL